jgi:hypothetical protein
MSSTARDCADSTRRRHPKDQELFSMKTRIASLPFVLYLVALHSPGIVLAGDVPGGVPGQRSIPWLADASVDSCVEECEAVQKQCKILCGETGARAEVKTGEVPYIPEGACLKDCEQDYAICRESC